MEPTADAIIDEIDNKRSTVAVNPEELEEQLDAEIAQAIRSGDGKALKRTVRNLIRGELTKARRE